MFWYRCLDLTVLMREIVNQNAVAYVMSTDSRRDAQDTH